MINAVIHHALHSGWLAVAFTFLRLFFSQQRAFQSQRRVNWVGEEGEGQTGRQTRSGKEEEKR